MPLFSVGKNIVLVFGKSSFNDKFIYTHTYTSKILKKENQEIEKERPNKTISVVVNFYLKASSRWCVYAQKA